MQPKESNKIYSQHCLNPSLKICLEEMLSSEIFIIAISDTPNQCT